jgi:cytochrome c oxidase subunit I
MTDTYRELQPIRPAPTSFLRKYVFSTDHKIVAKQFLWAGLVFLAVGGGLAMLMRWQWAYPGRPLPGSDFSISPALYTQLFTLHGLIMLFFAITPMLIGTFGNFCIPLLIGAREMAFPKLSLLSFWTFALSLALIVTSFCVPLGTASAGWTTYPPLSARLSTPGLGQTLVVLALFVTAISTVLGAINTVTTVVRLRARGMTYLRLPLSVWGLWLTAILNLLFVPVLAAATLLLLLDRELGTEFFSAATQAGRGGDPVLFQHLFWIFGHPEVYILILPAWGIIGDLLSFFARKPHYWYRGSVYAMIAVTGLSALVYGHHLFTTGINPLLGKGFMLLTLIISVPAELLCLNWLHTVYRGSVRLTTPMLFALGVVFVFGLGGLTGMFLAAVSTDLYLHDTLFVVGHFHFTLAAATWLSTFGAIYFWFPKMFGRMLDERLGQIHFWASLPLICLVFGGQLVAGYSGQPRRLWDAHQYTFLQHLWPLNRATSWAAFALALSQLVFVYNWFHSLRQGARAKDNPWEVGTLEWTVSSPPPHYNFQELPIVRRGPHEFSNPRIKAQLGSDWIGQSESLPDDAVDTVDAEEAARHAPSTGRS